MVSDLAQRWLAEAQRNQVLPIDDTLTSRIGANIGPAYPAGSDRTFHSGAGPVCDESIPLLFAGFRFTARVTTADDPAGVLLAMGDWNGGFALFSDGRLTFTYSRAGEMLEQPPTGWCHRGRRISAWLTTSAGIPARSGWCTATRWSGT